MHSSRKEWAHQGYDIFGVGQIRINITYDITDMNITSLVRTIDIIQCISRYTYSYGTPSSLTSSKSIQRCLIPCESIQSNKSSVVAMRFVSGFILFLVGCNSYMTESNLILLRRNRAKNINMFCVYSYCL
jgi:hypothetical protein